MVETPVDGHVLISAEVFQEIIARFPDLEIESWGTADLLTVRGVIAKIYKPVIRKQFAEPE